LAYQVRKRKEEKEGEKEKEMDDLKGLLNDNDAIGSDLQLPLNDCFTIDQRIYKNDTTIKRKTEREEKREGESGTRSHLDDRSSNDPRAIGARGVSKHSCSETRVSRSWSWRGSWSWRRGILRSWPREKYEVGLREDLFERVTWVTVNLRELESELGMESLQG